MNYKSLLLVLACLCLYSGCRSLSARRDKTLAELSAMLETPPAVLRAMQEFDANGPRKTQACDPRLIVGPWVNQVGYAGGGEITFKADGRYECDGIEGEYFTMRCEGADWIYRIVRCQNNIGRSLQIYVIEGDQLFMRFQRPEARWELWTPQPAES